MTTDHDPQPRAILDPSFATDPRDPRPDAEMAGRTGIWRHHNCYRCRNGERFCVQGDAHQCEYPRARND